MMRDRRPRHKPAGSVAGAVGRDLIAEMIVPGIVEFLHALEHLLIAKWAGQVRARSGLVVDDTVQLMLEIEGILVK